MCEGEGEDQSRTLHVQEKTLCIGIGRPADRDVRRTHGSHVSLRTIYCFRGLVEEKSSILGGAGMRYSNGNSDTEGPTEKACSANLVQ